ncbi:hypothetical protein FRC07_009324 [Ceratobasidium sp. 392]|nr:hypothetical protein FRC07_009324 [Ceratobasidium sp. 392]
MVVLTDSQPGSPVKSVHTWANSQPGTSQAGSSRAGPSSPRSPLPRGVVRSPNAAESNPPPPYVPSPSTAPLLPGPPQKPRPSVAKRFFGAFVVAVIILMGFNIIGHMFSWIIRGRDSYEWDNNPWKEDGNVLTCENSWSPPRKSNEDMDDFRSLEVPGVTGQMHIPAYPVFSAFESFQLPINSSLHYLIARGSVYSGVAVIRGDEGADPNVIGVNVTVRYSSQRALSRAKICMLQTSEGGHGIGIYTPRNRFDWGDENRDRLRFLVTVTIPISRASLLNLNAFDTHLPNFRHKFEQLGDRVQFEHLSVEGTNGVIQSDSLYVSEGMLKTTNGGINGQFNTTDSLVLQTTNGVVDIDVGITNDDTHRASNLFVQSTNGRLESRVSLLTTHDQRPQPKGGHFTVQTRTTNGQLNVQFPTSPIDSLLDFDGHTTNSPADISLHASYEGSFRIKTSNGGPEVDNEHARDPTGKGRYRTVNVSKSSKNEVQGKIFWGHEKDHNEGTETGRAVIQTSNGWARLRLR